MEWKKLMELNRTNDRTFFAAYDSTNQDPLFRAWSSYPTNDDLSGADLTLARLRLETLLSGTIVLSDTQILDGSIFRVLTNEDLLIKTARSSDKPLPIEIRCRANTIEQSLWKTYVIDEPGGRLVPKAFLPSSFSNGSDIKTELAKIESVKLKPGIEGVVELLHRAGAQDEELAAAKKQWTKLVKLERKKRIVVRSWDGSFAHCMDEARCFNPPHEYRNDVLDTAEGRTLFDRVIGLGFDRSTIYEVLDDAESSASEGLSQDAVWIRHWWDQTYQRAQAFQHAADFRGIDDALYPRLAIQEIIKEVGGSRRLLKVEIPPGSLTYLAMLPDLQWQAFQDRRLGLLHAWWHRGHVDSLKRIIDDLATEAAIFGPVPSVETQELKTFSTMPLWSPLTKFVKCGGGAIGGASFLQGWTGALAGVIIVIAQSALENRINTVDKASHVEVTDYFDDVG